MRRLSARLRRQRVPGLRGPGILAELAEHYPLSSDTKDLGRGKITVLAALEGSNFVPPQFLLHCRVKCLQEIPSYQALTRCLEKAAAC